jgi:outer membrane protein assembly factor BamB
VDALAESSTTPVRVGDLLFASSVTFGSVGLKLTEKDGRPAYEQLWKDPKMTCYFGTPVAFGEHLYVVTGSVTPPAALNCVEAKTGKVLWTRQNVGQYHATVMRAKDRLLLLEEGGDLVLFEPNPKEYKELARSKVCGKTWAHPALANGKLYVRDEKELICVQLAKP